jgi:hypothetical protein
VRRKTKGNIKNQIEQEHTIFNLTVVDYTNLFCTLQRLSELRLRGWDWKELSTAE